VRVGFYSATFSVGDGILNARRDDASYRRAAAAVSQQFRRETETDKSIEQMLCWATS
jgi:hypothetical protein